MTWFVVSGRCSSSPERTFLWHRDGGGWEKGGSATGGLSGLLTAWGMEEKNSRFRAEKKGGVAPTRGRQSESRRPRNRVEQVPWILVEAQLKFPPFALSFSSNRVGSPRGASGWLCRSAGGSVTAQSTTRRPRPRPTSIITARDATAWARRGSFNCCHLPSFPNSRPALPLCPR